MKAYKVEVLVLDNEQLGEDSIKYLLENVKSSVKSGSKNSDRKSSVLVNLSEIFQP